MPDSIYRAMTFRGNGGRPCPVAFRWDGDVMTLSLYPASHRPPARIKHPVMRLELGPEEMAAFAQELISPLPPVDPIQDQIAAWARETFGYEPIAGVLAHLDEEHDELYDAIQHPRPGGVAEELADMAILLYKLAAMQGVDLDAAVEVKHARNQDRTWGPIGPDGAQRHIEEDDHAAD